MDLLAAITFAAGTVVACIGWGRLVERLVANWGDELPLPRLSTGIAACIGLAASLCAAGAFVAVDQYGSWLGWLWLATGLALAIHSHWRLIARWWTTRNSLWIGAATLAVLGAEALYRTGSALGSPPWNLCDDTVAYLPLVDRLIETGGMIEPFSQRRIANLGGFSAFDSLFTNALGFAGAFVADMVAGGLLVGLLLLGRPAGLRRFMLGALLVVSFTLWDSLRNNLSPTDLVVAMIAAALLLVAETCRSRADLLDRRVLVLIGLLGAGLLTLRAAFAVPVAIFGVALIVRATGAGFTQRLRAVGVFGLTMVLPVVPWMLALWRSSGTPLYPPVSGNLDPSWPGFRDSTVNLVAKLGDVLATGDLAWMLGAVLVTSGVLVALRRSVWAEAPLLALPGALATMAITLVSLSAFPTFDHARYAWPVLAGLLVAALSLLANEASSSLRQARGVTAAAVVIAVVCTLAAPTGRVRGDVDAAVAGIKGAWADEAPPEPGSLVHDDYTNAQASLPRNAKIATASDYPYFFDHERNDVVNLDFLGSVSPAPGMPLGDAPEEMTAYLRDQGIDFVVAVGPEASRCFYNEPIWGLQVSEHFEPGATWAPFFLDWFAYVRKRAAMVPGKVSHYGTLNVLDLREGS